MITYKALFSRIEKAERERRTDVEWLTVNAIHMAMDIRQHPAAYDFEGGHGMVTAYRDGGYDTREAPAFRDSLVACGIVAALVTRDGMVLTESHESSGLGKTGLSKIENTTPCGGMWSQCSSYLLPTDGGDILKLDGGRIPRHPNSAKFRIAYGFHENLNGAIRGKFDIAEVPSEARTIATRILVDADHRFIHPTLDRFVGFALAEAL